MVATSLAQFHLRLNRAFPDRGNPEAVVRASVRILEGQRIRYGYAGYWVAYQVTFLSQGRLVLASPLPDRNSAITKQVGMQPTPAWIFVLFGGTNVRGPENIPESQFVEILSRERVPFRVVHAGPIEAVIPARRVTPQDL